MNHRFKPIDLEVAALPLAIFTVGMAAVLVVALTPEPAPQVAKAPQAEQQTWAWQGPAPISGDVDWNAVEASTDDGSAIAAYER